MGSQAGLMDGRESNSPPHIGQSAPFRGRSPTMDSDDILIARNADDDFSPSHRQRKTAGRDLDDNISY